ncbi:hypothetical protein SARC_00602 [Sphaeroforma arctica JP610]|uniref:Uncharacterized protein n=1 Tax=Sphaeroforma arctica JP610 TaxID=667725 RepID=A0A0L0GEF1_9EUKA|nr:hypothetical protein SARC_00602 [Sphaeroforma arctica JP610]KNC87274.1 hypothetical protein SARC_00602 [Sphaeroforma arctica JP610]|eukprot:XP_014161176.1 hypothetical protein SARC_00602 [Sphaeroforma arctica JP610]
MGDLNNYHVVGHECLEAYLLVSQELVEGQPYADIHGVAVAQEDDCPCAAASKGDTGPGQDWLPSKAEEEVEAKWYKA